MLAHLQDRGVIFVIGDDAVPFLDNIVTNDVTTLPAYTALLTPQGKIIADFFVAREGQNTLVLDVPLARAAELTKRLTMYKLRAKVEIKDNSANCSVLAFWSEDGAPPPASLGNITFNQFRDPRHPGLGWRTLGERIEPSIAAGLDVGADYTAHRIRLGVPEGGKDWGFGDTFAHEALLDQLRGVNFTKGCYVGQEIVSRMQHRGTARKRVVRVVADVTLPATGTEVHAGTVPIGTLGSTAGAEGLALMRLDRAAEAIAKGEPITIGGVPARIDIPPWATFGMSAPT